MNEIDVTTGSLDEPAKVPPKIDIFVGSKLPWVVLDEDLPRFPGERLA